MKIGGFQKTSLLDYPGQISSIIWTVGCNFRCPFCYNKEIVEEKKEKFAEKEVLEHLEKRKGLIDALVVSGGEPFLQNDLKDFLGKVKKLGYLVKIDTNGMYPEKLEELLDEKLVDYVAMDIKGPKKKYDLISGKKVDIKKIEKSIEIIKKKSPNYEFRTTIIPDYLEKKDFLEIAKWLDGSDNFYLQQFKNDVELIDDKLRQTVPYSKNDLIDVMENIKPYFVNCDVRGL